MRTGVAFLAVLLALTGCHKHTASVPVAIPTIPPAIVNELEGADHLFEAGSYAEARQAYEDYLQRFPQGNQRDAALFRLGLTYALESTNPDWQQAAKTFRELEQGFPQSPFGAPAKLILSLNDSVVQGAAESQVKDQKIQQLSLELKGLDDADRLFEAANYVNARRAYETYLQRFAQGNLRDAALFRLGLTYALESANPDWQQVNRVFRQLQSEDPQSPFGASARFIMGLHDDLNQTTTESRLRDQKIQQLTTELNRLKAIDSQRKRP